MSAKREREEVQGRYHTMLSKYQWIEAEIQNLKLNKASIEEVDSHIVLGLSRLSLC